MKSQAILTYTVQVSNQSFPEVYMWYGLTPISHFVVIK